MEGLAQDFLEIQAPQGTRNLPTISAQPNVNKTSNSAINQCSPYTPPSQVGADIRFYHRLGCCGNFYHKVDFCGNRMSIFCGGVEYSQNQFCPGRPPGTRRWGDPAARGVAGSGRL